MNNKVKTILSVISMVALIWSSIVVYIFNTTTIYDSVGNVVPLTKQEQALYIVSKVVMILTALSWLTIYFKNLFKHPNRF